jgi:hypothetical protein
VEFLQNYARGNFKMETGREVDWELNVPIEKLIEIMKVNSRSETNYFTFIYNINFIIKEFTDRAPYNGE